jgi:hypothetical protein
MVSPAVAKTCSDGAEVAGILKILDAKADKYLNFLSCTLHQHKGFLLLPPFSFSGIAGFQTPPNTRSILHQLLNMLILKLLLLCKIMLMNFIKQVQVIQIWDSSTCSFINWLRLNITFLPLEEPPWQ